MTTFDGFPDGKTEWARLPALFFRDLMPLIDDLGELKVTLFAMYALQQREGTYRYLTRADFDDVPSLAGVNIDDGLARATARKALLCAKLRDGRMLYLFNTARGREAVASIAAGHVLPAGDDGDVEILPPRPNIFKLYEDNFGPLTPLIADELKDAEKDYPHDWIEAAFREAVQSEKRSWRYTRAILERWRKEGKTSHETTGRHHEPNGQRYIAGNYADFIDH